MRASFGPDADVSYWNQVRGMGDVVDGQRFGGPDPACSADRAWLEHAAQFRVGRLLLAPARNPLVEVAKHDGSARSVGADPLELSQPLNLFIPRLAIPLTGRYMRGRPGNANPYNVEWSSLRLGCCSDEAPSQRPFRLRANGDPFPLAPQDHLPMVFVPLLDCIAPIGPGVDAVATIWKEILVPSVMHKMSQSESASRARTSFPRSA